MEAIGGYVLTVLDEFGDEELFVFTSPEEATRFALEELRGPPGDSPPEDYVHSP